LKVSIALPAYNEADKIEEAVNSIMKTLDGSSDQYEIIIAEDGCSDETPQIAARLAEDNGNVIHMHSDTRLGRGEALTRAFKTSSGSILAYLDVDLATEMTHLRELIDAICIEGYDFATGSRMLPESEVKRSKKRNLMSSVFNALVRLMLGSKLRDHQCGFKAFRRESLFDILQHVESKHWFWDTETLVHAQLRGYRVKEIPVKWRSDGETKVATFKDTYRMISNILRLWWRLKTDGSG
jgi:glycosyltransferase involved in cell wall biosynthesis